MKSYASGTPIAEISSAPVISSDTVFSVSVMSDAVFSASVMSLFRVSLASSSPTVMVFSASATFLFAFLLFP